VRDENKIYRRFLIGRNIYFKVENYTNGEWTRFREFLGDILGSRVKIKIIRIFLRFPEKEFIEGELEELSGNPHQSITYALKDMVNYQLVTVRKIGRNRVYSLNRDNYIVKDILSPMFENEAGSIQELIGDMKTSLASLKIERAVIYGSIVMAQEEFDSDIDLLVIVSNKGEVKAVGNALADLRNHLLKKFGNSLSPIIMTRDEYEKQKKLGKGLIKSVESGMNVIEE
jgi:predicted nucleotidyltransferase